METSKWCVYMVTNGKRTYIGATTDVKRRLRQHNGEIVGGARSTTKGRPWTLVCWLENFPDKSVAYRWEKIIKSRCRGYQDRFKGFSIVQLGGCPIKGRLKAYTPPPGLKMWVMSQPVTL